MPAGCDVFAHCCDPLAVPQPQRAACRAVGGHNEYFPRLWCPQGRYSLFGQLFFVPLSKSLRLLIHLGEPVATAATPYQYQYHLVALAMHAVLTYFLMAWTYGIGAASGLFVPCLAVGASAGRLAGQLATAALAALGAPPLATACRASPGTP
jgi:chloride channel 7